MELGHIVAVRYSWNSYVGSVGYKGLHATGALRFAFFGPQSIDGKAYKGVETIETKHCLRCNKMKMDKLHN